MKQALIAIAIALAVAVGLALAFPDRAREVLPAPVASVLPGGGEEDGERSAQRAVPVRLSDVVEATATERFETSGAVLAAEEVMLSAEVPGQVAEVFVADGARVVQGEPILRFENASEKAAVEAARAALAEAEANLRRAIRLYREDVAAESRVETARATADAERADLSRAEAALADTIVRAPFSGEIGFVDVDPGAFLDPGAPIARLARTNELRVRFSLPVEEAARVRESGSVTVTAPDGGEVEAEILTVSPVTDPASRTRAFEAALPPGVALSPGAFVPVSVVTARREGALLVPQTALLREAFSASVFRAARRDGRLVAERVTVEPGVLGPDGLIEIRGELSAGDRVVSSGIQKVGDGTPIRPLEAGDDADGAGPEDHGTAGTGDGAGPAGAAGGDVPDGAAAAAGPDAGTAAGDSDSARPDSAPPDSTSPDSARSGGASSGDPRSGGGAAAAARGAGEPRGDGR